MLEYFKMISEWLKKRSPAEIARVTAVLIVPGGIFAAVVSGVFGDSLRWDLPRPLTISQLRTETPANGNTTARPGVALIFEPAASDDYFVQFQSPPGRMWSSLDEKTAQANHGRLAVDSSGINGKTPFLGVSDPVTVIVEGQIGDHVLLPGRRIKTDDLQLPSHQAESIVASVLLSCAFAFGMSLARGFPSTDRAKETAS